MVVLANVIGALFLGFLVWRALRDPEAREGGRDVKNNLQAPSADSHDKEHLVGRSAGAARRASRAGPAALAFLLLAASATSAADPGEALPVEPTLADYLDYAAAHNEGLRAATLAWRAAAEREAQAGSLPDPRFTLTEQFEPVETRVGPQQRAFALSQTVPWFGTLSLRGGIERERAAAEAAGADAAALELALSVKRSYYELAYLGRAVDVAREHLALVTRWEEAARSRYATGDGGYADVVKAQLEIGRLEERLAELRDRRRPLAAALNAALGRELDAAVPWPGPFTPRPARIDRDALALRLGARNPELEGLERRVRAFGLAEKLAGRQRYPDLTFGLSYVRTGEARMAGVADSGKDPVMASLSVNVPLWRGKYAAAAREAAGNRQAALATLRDRRNRLTADLEQALFGHRDALRKLDLYGDTLLPKGRQSLAAAQAAYETGAARFLDLVDAQRVLLEFELARARAASDLMVSRAEIEMLVGGLLDDAVE